MMHIMIAKAPSSMVHDLQLSKESYHDSLGHATSEIFLISQTTLLAIEQQTHVQELSNSEAKPTTIGTACSTKPACKE